MNKQNNGIMKRLILITSCWLMVMVSINAQTIEQKKICALKWTLQQTFYNKVEGQQIAHLNVCDFKSLSEFQKNELVSNALKQISNPTDQKRIKNIIGATSDGDLISYVPSGGKAKYKDDVEKIKSQASSTGDESENKEASAADSQEDNTNSEIKTVEEAKAAQDTAKVGVEEDIDSASISDTGMSFLSVALISLGIYVILTLCIYFFIKSRKNAQNEDEIVTMDQYRDERLKLIERIKALEIVMENIRSVKREPEVVKQANSTAHIPTTPIFTAPAAKPTTQSLFDDKKPEIITPSHEESAVRTKSSVVMFYPVPVDGVFSNGTTEIEVGTSLYMLKSNDGKTATFQILNTSEAIGTALVSLPDMVKPACKILNTVNSPVEILAEKLGTAEREGDGWKITNKAIVRLI